MSRQPLATLFFLAIGVLVLIPLGLALLASVLGDLGMLIDAFGLWGIVIFLVPTATMLVLTLFVGPPPPR